MNNANATAAVLDNASAYYNVLRSPVLPSTERAQIAARLATIAISLCDDAAPEMVRAAEIALAATYGEATEMQVRGALSTAQKLSARVAADSTVRTSAYRAVLEALRSLAVVSHASTAADWAVQAMVRSGRSLGSSLDLAADMVAASLAEQA